MTALGSLATLLAHVPATAHMDQGEDGKQVESGVFEEAIHFRPSGPITIRRWRDPTSRELLKIEMLGAVSGEPIFTGARLLRNKSGEWRVRFDDGSACLLYRKKEDLYKPITCTDHCGRNWSVEVKDVSEPVAIPGVATEEEPRLTILFKYQPL
jgi:hypothetical protein